MQPVSGRYQNLGARGMEKLNSSRLSSVSGYAYLASIGQMREVPLPKHRVREVPLTQGKKGLGNATVTARASVFTDISDDTNQSVLGRGMKKWCVPQAWASPKSSPTPDTMQANALVSWDSVHSLNLTTTSSLGCYSNRSNRSNSSRRTSISSLDVDYESHEIQPPAAPTIMQKIDSARSVLQYLERDGVSPGSRPTIYAWKGSLDSVLSALSGRASVKSASVAEDHSTGFLAPPASPELHLDLHAISREPTPEPTFEPELEQTSIFIPPLTLSDPEDDEENHLHIFSEKELDLMWSPLSSAKLTINKPWWVPRLKLEKLGDLDEEEAVARPIPETISLGFHSPSKTYRVYTSAEISPMLGSKEKINGFKDEVNDQTEMAKKPSKWKRFKTWVKNSKLGSLFRKQYVSVAPMPCEEDTEFYYPTEKLPYMFIDNVQFAAEMPFPELSPVQIAMLTVHGEYYEPRNLMFLKSLGFNFKL